MVVNVDAVEVEMEVVRVVDVEMKFGFDGWHFEEAKRELNGSNDSCCW